jgi:hypothetical protein
MVTNYPQPMTSHDDRLSEADEPEVDAFGGRIVDRLRQLFCGLHGHDPMLHFEHGRMSLQCVSCGHETPGWELNETPPTVTVHGDARHHMIRPQLVRARRVA